MSQILPHSHNIYNVGSLKIQLSNLSRFQAVTDIFSDLSDANRVRIFWLLCHCEECVTNISALVGMSSPAVSHHLRRLKASGLIVSRRVGKEVYYKATDSELAGLLHIVTEKIMEISCPE